MKLSFIEIPPAGHRTEGVLAIPPAGHRTEGVLAGGQLKAITLPYYHKTEQGKCLRELRVTGGKYISMPNAARAIGMDMERLSGLECGKYTLSEEEWGQLFEALDKLKTKGEA